MQAWPGSYAHISYGLPFTVACAKHVTNTFKASRIYILASGSLSRNTSHVRDLEKALSGKVVGITNGMKSHTLWSEVLSSTEAARAANADLIITLGAGTLTDAAKIITLALANNATTFADLDRLRSGAEGKYAPRHDLKAPTVPIVSVPTSLSGGEYARTGGGTNDESRRKFSFGGPTKGPALVLLDPDLTADTPEFIWLSTGVRAIDHCVEIMCSLSATEKSDQDASSGLRRLVPGLLRCKRAADQDGGGSKRDADGNEGRMQCMLGVVDAMKGIHLHGIPTGASHGIGHQLGPLGVSHGETSCVMLPYVCKFNASVNEKQQGMVRDVLWGEQVVKEVLQRRGLEKQSADLGDVLLAIFRELGMPTTLKEVNVGRYKLDNLAENSVKDHAAETNPIPLRDKKQVLEILELALG